MKTTMMRENVTVQERLVKAVIIIAALMMLFFNTKTASAAESNPDRFQSRTVTISTYDEIVAAMKEALNDHAPKLQINFRGRCSLDTLSTALDYITERKTFHTYGQANYAGANLCHYGSYAVIDFTYYTTVEEELFLDSYVENFVNATVGYTDYEKIRLVHDMVCMLADYDYDTLNGLAENRSAYDTVVTGKTVCSGYAMLFQRVMDRLGILSRYCSGELGGGRHAWNVVLLDGLWYHLDCTWDDQSWGISYDYFLLGMDRMKYPESQYQFAATSYAY